jgi:hypothetical protein
MLKKGQVYKYEKNKFEIDKIENGWVFVKDIPYKNVIASTNWIQEYFFKKMVNVNVYQLQEKKK